MAGETATTTRPRTLDPHDIGFTPQRAVPWLNPGLLVGTAVRVVLARLFGGYLDKRELQAALPSRVHDYSKRDELWIDYTADVGDGFDAAYSVAYTMAQPALAADGDSELPRPQLLVLGGDEVYPVASALAYMNRWKGPYHAALPEQSDDSPTVFALPGNHDWYDGLTSFIRVFAQRDPVGGWKTEQTRSYYAIKLPHGWWLWAVDTQLDAYFDEPQLDYFHAAAGELGPDDRIILCLARPAWMLADADPIAYDTVDFFIRKVIEPTGVRVPVMLAGDLHHYVRYEGNAADGAQRQLITCGGGGAYLVGTDHVPTEITVPPAESTSRRSSVGREYRLAAAYPSRDRTRVLDWSVFWRLPWRNPGFVAMLGLFQTLLMLAMLTSDGRWAVDDWTINAPIGFAILAVFTGTVLFATVIGRRTLQHWFAGIIHGVPHVALGALGSALWSDLPVVDWVSPLPLFMALAVYLPVIGLIDTWILCGYLLVARWFGVNANELYAGIGVDDYKCFLRLHIRPDGTLAIYPIGIDKISRHWRANPDGPSESSWIVPRDGIKAHVIEPALAIPPHGRGS